MSDLTRLREPGHDSGERILFGARSKNCVLDPRYGAKRLQRSLAGIKEAGVAHDAANPLWCPDNLDIASGGLQDAEDPGVENRNDLRQPRRDRDFADAQYELSQDIVDDTSASFWLAGGRGGADARTFPYGGALDLFSVEQLRKDVTQHFWTGGWQQSQGTPVFFSIGIDRYEIERVCIVEYVSLVAIFNFDLPAKPTRKVSALFRNIASISLGKKDAYEPSISLNIAHSFLHLNATKADGALL
jgi:hypothetical protein